MKTAIYTRVIMCKDEPYKPSEIEVGHRLDSGAWCREKGFDYHHGAPPEYSHEQAAKEYRYRHALYEDDLRPGELHMAPANDKRHTFIFI